MNDVSRRDRDGSSLYLFLAVLVLLVAAGLRIIAIRDAPPGPRFDETFDALMARRILNGEHPIYFPENFGEEALNIYFQAASLAAFGWNDLALRFPSIAFGLIEVAAVYALGKRAWNRRAGLLASALCAASFWAVLFSRLGMRLTTLTALVSLGVLMLFRLHASRARDKQWPMGGAAGLLFGLSVHTYTAARALPLLLMGMVIYLALFHRAGLRKQAAHWILVIIIATLIAAPLAYYLVTHPQVEMRVEQISGPFESLRKGDAAPLFQYALAAVGMFGVRGGSEWLYNLPSRPVFDPITAMVFLVGVVVALIRWRARRTAFVLIWLAAGLAPIVLSWPPASTSHAILAQPAVYLLAGLGLDVVLAFAALRAGQFTSSFLRSAVIARARSARSNLHAEIASSPAESGPARNDRKKQIMTLHSIPVILGLAIVALNVALTVRDYVAWNASDSIRWEHQATVTEMGRYADAHPELHDVAFMGNAVDYYSPWMKVGNSLTSRRTDVRWFNPARALLWNPAGPVTYLLPFRDPNPITFNQIISDTLLSAARQTLDEKLPDGRPVFTAYEMADTAALHAQAIASGKPSYDFGGRLVLIGYEARPAQARPGESIRVLTYWRVTRVDASPLVMFVHLFRPDSKPVTQEDRLDVALETLHVGDEFMQTHRVTLPGDAQPGMYRIAIGLYSPVTQIRVPVEGSNRVEFDLVVK